MRPNVWEEVGSIALRSDADIRRDVETEFKNDPALDATGIGLNVTNGEVSPTGYVREFSQKYAVENAVKRVTDVTAIANDIELRRGRRDLLRQSFEKACRVAAEYHTMITIKRTQRPLALHCAHA